jgi:hypothetical protein
MSEKTSRYILILEAALIALPLSSLAIWGSISFIIEALNFRYAISIIMGILAFFGLLAIGSGWHLFIIYLRKGGKELKNQPIGWWLIIFIGVMILVASLISNLLPPSPEYSRWWNFRALFDVVAFGLPMLIPLCHLAFERLFRKTSS